MSNTRRFSFLVWVAIIVPLATAALVVPAALSSKDASTAGKRTIDVALCTAVFSAPVDDAEVEEDRARERREAAFADGLVAATSGDEAAVEDAAKRITVASKDIAAALDAREVALSDVEDALVLASKDPVAFLAECRARQ